MASINTTSKAGRHPSGISLPWLVAFAAMICVIWGNSLVPGTGSGALSSTVLGIIQGAISAIGLDPSWLTEHMVRKAAHFTEYMVLSLIAMQAFAPHRAPVRGWRIALCAAAVVAVPCLDETIQLFVDGRCGAVTDVLIDCGGAAVGALLTVVVSRIRAACKARRA